jgi:glycosyltransferase involved in cell wall biosynthesis
MRRPVHFVVPGAIGQRTGGYGYDRQIVLGLRAAGRQVIVHELPGNFPETDPVARAAAARLVAEVWQNALPVIDGLALPAFVEVARDLPRPWLALVHHPLALETGLDPAAADALRSLERDLLALAAGVVATSPRTRRDLAHLGIAPERVAVVPPGTDPAPLARCSAGSPLSLLCVATLVPRKGHPTLIEALARLRDLDWRLTCVGSTVRDPDCTRSVVAAIARHDLTGRIEVRGEVGDRELARHYDAADLVVLASHHEGYGMVLAETLVRGLPIVATTAGAIPETVPATAALLVPPGEVGALSEALRRAITDTELRATLAASAAAAGRRLPTWPEAVRAFAAELDRLAA